MNFTTLPEGSVSSPMGFTAAGITAGLKRNGHKDLAMIASERPATAAAAFTSNLFAAAPVEWDRQLMNRGKQIRAVVVNSGIANACTGSQGAHNAQEMATYTAEKIGCDRMEVMVASTGRIGVQLPMDVIRSGIDLAVSGLSKEGGVDAAQAIMTTDTVAKHIAVTLTLGGKKVTIGAMTKGAGMIAPQMTPCRPRPKQATELSFVTTDAALSQEALQEALNFALERSFNRIIVDGDTSTNDTLLLLANGLAGNPEIADTAGSDWRLFTEALTYCMSYLAKEMVLDGEGVSKFVELTVTGTADDASARQIAEAIARSPLCKTAWFGCDPNWGRILCAAGYSKVAFKPPQVDLDYDDVPIVRNGMGTDVPEETQVAVMKKREFAIHLSVGKGPGRFVLWTCDLTHDYVTINADYHT